MPTGVYPRTKKHIAKYKEAMQAKVGWNKKRVSLSPVCDTCGCLTGDGYPQSLSNYRDKMLCGACVHAWQRLDRRLKRQSTWEEFVTPKNPLESP